MRLATMVSASFLTELDALPQLAVYCEEIPTAVLAAMLLGELKGPADGPDVTAPRRPRPSRTASCEPNSGSGGEI